MNYKNLDKTYYYSVTRFLNKKYVSTALIQRRVKVPYSIASAILDKMVVEGFASSRIGAYPSEVLSGRFKKVKSLNAQLKIHLKLLLPSIIYAFKVWRIKMTVKYLKRL